MRAGLVKEPGDYPYSSYQYFTSHARAPDWLSLDFILPLFDKNVKKAKSLYKKFVLDGLGKETEVISKNMNFGFLLGNQDFIENIKTRFIQGKQDREIPVLKTAHNELNPNDIKERIIKKIGDNKLSRTIAIYLIRKQTGLSLKDIALLFNHISDAGVSAFCRRVDQKRTKDKKQNRIIAEMEKLLIIET